VSDVWWSFVPVQDMVDNVYNRCYAKFVNKISDTADMATNLAEHKEACEMMTTRVVQLYKFTRALRRLRFGDAADALGISRHELKKMNLRSSSKAFGKNWLEFHFGWSPLIGDISTAMDILTSGLPPFKVFTKHSAGKSFKTNDSTNNDNLHFGTTSYYAGCKIAAHISVTNENMWLANRLGLLNPLALAWELVPFSFVLDWFVNLNDVLKSFTEFYGLSLINPFHTEYHTLERTENHEWYAYAWWLPGNPRYRSRQFNWSCAFASVTRTTGLPGPTLRVRPAKVLSWQRGLTAASLLVQHLKG